MVDAAFLAIALAGAVDRGHPVIIGRFGFETLQTHAPDGLRMGAVEPDVTIDDLTDELMPVWRVVAATPEQHARAFAVVVSDDSA